MSCRKRTLCDRDAVGIEILPKQIRKMTDKASGRYLVNNNTLAAAAARDHPDLAVKQKPYIPVFLACAEDKSVLLEGDYFKACLVVLDERIYRRLCQNHPTHSFIRYKLI